MRLRKFEMLEAAILLAGSAKTATLQLRLLPKRQVFPVYSLLAYDLSEVLGCN